MDNKVKIILLISVVIGVVLCVVSWGKINTYQQKQLDTVEVVVASRNIEAYSLLSNENLKTINVSSKFVDDYTVVDSASVKGKITNVPVYMGKPIDSRYVTDKPKDIGNRQVVGVYIDVVRYSGVNNGDIVDVFWVGSKDKFTSATKIASNARVLKIANGSGEEIQELDGALRSTAVSAGITKADTPSAVYLLVKPEEVPFVIQGSNKSNSDRIALAKKSEDTKDEVLNLVVEGETVEETVGRRQ